MQNDLVQSMRTLQQVKLRLSQRRLRVLSESETPPFQIEENSKTKEEVRLKYRYLDLRRPDMQRNLMMRSKVATLARQFMANEGFLEIETPVSSEVHRREQEITLYQAAFIRDIFMHFHSHHSYLSSF